MRARAFTSFVILAAMILGAGGPGTAHAGTGQIVLISQDEALQAYDIDAGKMYTLIPGGTGPTSEFVNGPPCFIPGDPDSRFVEADDNPFITWNNGTENGDAQPFFQVFSKAGKRLTTDDLGDHGRIGAEAGMHDPAGCTFDASGNLFGVDVGTIHAPLIGDGQLVEFFAPDYKTFCVLDSNLAQPGMVTFDRSGGLLVPEAGFARIDRYTAFPASAATCAAGATKKPWIVSPVNDAAAAFPTATPASTIGTPISITRDDIHGGFAVGSVLVPPAIFHVTDDAVVDGVIAAPGPDTGTPFGMAYDKAGNLWYADLGVRPFPLDGTDPSDPIDSAQDQGAFRVVDAGGAPVGRVLATGWQFPDGVTVVPASAVDLPDEESPATSGCDWPMYGHDLGRSMAQACSKINQTNVATLHPKWIFNAGAPVTAQPAVVDGVVYVGAADGTFYALPADAIGTPTPLWTFKISDANRDSYGKFVSSAAVATVADTKVVVAAGGSTLHVLDAATGHELGSVCVDPRTDPAVRCKGSAQIIEIESSPAIVVDGDSARIYVGMDYNEGGIARAGMIRFTLRPCTECDGPMTKWFLTPDWKFDPEGLATYTGPDLFSAGGRGQGCGNTWSSPTVDLESNLVYFDTSNCDTGRYDDHTLYGGESVFAVDATTGALAWCYSPRPVNDDDLDFGATPNLLSGARVGVGGKDGKYYAFKRTAINPVSHDATTACRGGNGQTPNWGTQVATGFSLGGFIGTPALGEVSGKEAVFAANAIPMPDEDTFSNPQRLATLHALDANTGEVLWDAPNPLPAYAGPAYTNGIVFAPDTFGMNFTAYNADFGVPMWSFPMFAPSGPPALDGDSVYVGSGVNPGTDAPIPGLDTGLGAIGAVYAFQVLAP